MDKTSVWQASNLIMAPPTDAGRTRIPTLQVRDPTMKHILREAVDNADKGWLLYETFFPKTNPNLTLPPVGYRSTTTMDIPEYRRPTDTLGNQENEIVQSQ